MRVMEEKIQKKRMRSRREIKRDDEREMRGEKEV